MKHGENAPFVMVVNESPGHPGPGRRKRGALGLIGVTAPAGIAGNSRVRIVIAVAGFAPGQDVALHTPPKLGQLVVADATPERGA